MTFHQHGLLLGLALACMRPAATGQCSIDIGNDTTICAGDLAILTGPPGYSNYLWSTGSTAQSIATGNAGTYWCQISYPSGQLVTNGNFSQGNTGFTTQFNYDPQLYNEPNYYIGLNANWYHPQFTGTGSGLFMMVNAGWMHGGYEVWCQTIDICPEQTYTVSFDATSLVGQGPPSLVWAVDGNWVSPVFTTPNGPNVWQNFSFNWTSAPGQTTAEFCLIITSAWGVGNDLGIDNISITGTVVLRDSVVVNVTPLPQVFLGNDTTICAGESFMLDATTPGATYLWQDGSTTPDHWASLPGWYNVAVTANGCTGTDAIQVINTPNPQVDLGNDTTVCPGATVVLDASNMGASYNWNNGTSGPTLVATTPGTYWVQVELNGCFRSDSIQVAHFNLQSVDLGPDTSLCIGEQLVLSNTIPGASYTWNNGSTLPDLTVIANGTYWLDVELNGCIVRDSINVTFDPLPQVDIGNDTSFCPGSSILLDAFNAGATYTWQDASTNSSLLADNAGSYWVEVDLNGCVASDTLIVGLHPLPAPDLGNDTTLCPGEVVLFDVTGSGSMFSWQDGSTGPTHLVSQAGAYHVSVTNSFGCSASDSVNVFFASPNAVDLGNDTSICQGASIQLDAGVPGASYLWNDGSTSQTISTTNAGTYFVAVSQGLCTAADTIEVTIDPLPIVQLIPDTMLCPGNTVLIDASMPGVNYLWQDGSTSASILAAIAGNYAVTVTDANGCSGWDDVNVSYASPLPVDLGPDVALCQGNSTLLDATTVGGSYLWSDGSNSSTLNVNSAGVYWVDVTQGSCTVPDTLVVQVFPAPQVELGNDTALCAGASLLLDATSPGAQIEWSNGSTSAQILVANSGTYFVDVDLNGCVASDTITVVLLSAPTPDLGNDTTLCPGEQYVLMAGTAGASLSWNDGSTGPDLLITQPGTYWVEASANGCSNADSIVVNYANLGALDLGPDTTFCIGASLLLDASAISGAAYQWQDGSTAATLPVFNSGTYWVNATLGNCNVSDTIQIGTMPIPVVDLGPDTALCAGGQVTFDVTLLNAAYQWNDGSTGPTNTGDPGDLLWVSVLQNGCSDSDTIEIGLLPSPVVDLGNDTILCPGQTYLLEGNLNNGNWQWSNGSTNSSILIDQAGSVWLEAELNGCTSVDTISINYLSQSSIDLGPDTMICPGANLLMQTNVQGASMLWSDGSSGNSLQVSNAGAYWVTAQVAGCTITDSIDVGIVQMPALSLGPDQELCAGESFTLQVNAGNGSVLWSDGSSNNTLTVDQSGTISVELTIQGCTVSDAITLTFNPMLNTLDLGPDATLCPGDVLMLEASIQGAVYQWQDGSTGASYLASNPGIYWVIATGDCIQASDTVMIGEGDCSPAVHVPNAFTPNADGVNDRFFVSVDGEVAAFELLIFDRWGEVIHRSTDPMIGWDGSHQGRPVQDGVYAWRVSLRSTASLDVLREAIIGHVVVIR